MFLFALIFFSVWAAVDFHSAIPLIIPGFIILWFLAEQFNRYLNDL